MVDLILSVDVGTSVVKAGCYTEEHQLVAMASCRSVVSGVDGVDADKVWDAVCTAVQAVVADPDLAGRSVGAVVVTGQGDGLWTIDKDGKAAGPAYQWNDSRAEQIVSGWEADGTVDDVYRLNDTVLWSGTSAAIWTWLRKNDPGHVGRVEWSVCATDWINYRLTGEVATDVSNAGIPFLDPDLREWSPALISRLSCEDLGERLPPVRLPGEILGGVTSEAATSTGLAVGTPVYLGSIDVVAMFRGLGIKRPGSVVAVLGTTAVALASTAGRPVSAEPVGATVPMPSPTEFLRVLGATSGMSTFDWYVSMMLEQELERDSYARVLDDVETVSAETASAMMLPFLAGERAPFLAPEATGTFIGITPSTTRAEMSYAVVEGITLALRHCVESAVADPDLIILTGGGAASVRWQQMTADVLGREVVVDDGPDRACQGAVSFVTGTTPDVPSDAVRVTPRPSAAIDERFARYVALTSSMRSAWRGSKGDKQ